MDSPETASLLLQVTGAMLSSAASILAWRRRSEPGATPLALLMLAVTEWGISAALELLLPSAGAKFFWVTAQILGASSAAVLYLLFVLEYIRQDKLLTRRNVVVLWAIPIISYALAVSNPWHGLFWSGSQLQGAAEPLLLQPGVLFWVYLGCSYLLRVAGTAALLLTIIRYPATHRSQAWILIAGALMPWLSNIAALLPLPARNFALSSQDLQPLAFALGGLILGWGIFRYRLFELVPLARDMIIDNLRDGIIVMDQAGRIVDMNSSAQRLLEIKADKSLGSPFRSALERYPQLIEMVEQQNSEAVEIHFAPPRNRHMEVRLLAITDGQNRQRGTMFTLRDITTQKRAEEALTKSENNLSLLLEAAPFPLTITSLDGRFIYSNQAALELFMLNAENPDARQKENITRQLRGAEDTNGQELKVRTAVGKEGWIASSTQRIMFNGEEALLSIQFDIDERKHAEEELRESRAQLQVIFDYAGVGIRVLDTQGKYVFSNGHWAGMLGLRPEDLIGRDETQYQHPNDIYYARQRFEALLSGEIRHYNLENRYLRADGTLFWGALAATPIFDENGQIESIVGFIIDITQRKQAEIALRETERRFREILENIHLLAVTLDKDGNITFCNDHILSLTGWQREEILGRNWFETFLAAEPQVRDEFSRAVRFGTIVSRHENTILTRWGEKRLASWSNILLRDSRGQVSGMASIGEDITERRRAQDAEREQRALAEALSDTASAMTTSLNLDETLDRILENVGKVVPHDAVGISLIQKNRVVVIRSKGSSQYDSKAEDQLENLSVAFGKLKSLKHMLETGEAFVIPDTYNEPSWVITPLTEWIRSYIGAPISAQGRVIGFLNLNSATPNFFNETHLERLSTFSSQAAIAIENARLFEQSQRELGARRRAEASLRRANDKLKTQLQEIESLQAKLQEQTVLLREETIRDPLTGLYNRRYLEEMLTREIARAERGGSPMSILMLDVDHFKNVNDVYGHPVGDLVLKALAGKLTAGTRRADIVCRYGGEEFAIILVEASLKNAFQRADKLRQTVQEMAIPYQDGTLRITISAGVATYPDHSQDGKELLELADQALYAAKQAGRNCVKTAHG